MNIKLTFEKIWLIICGIEDQSNRDLMLGRLDFDSIDSMIELVGEFAFVFLSDEESTWLIEIPKRSIDLFDFNGDFVGTVPPEKIGL